MVISYRELRELELQVLRADHELSAHKGQLAVDVHGLIGVNVDQFYGIEIEEFPAQIAQVALWLVDHQMNLRVSVEFGLYFARIPLKSTPHIQHANALRVDWNEVLPAQRCSYVLGNPPFLGKTYQSKEQKADLAAVMHGIHGAGDLDFVCGWYVLAAHKYMQGHAQARKPLLYRPTASPKANKWPCCGARCNAWACTSTLRTARFSGATKPAATRPCIA